jgi:hypothetical protein
MRRCVEEGAAVKASGVVSRRMGLWRTVGRTTFLKPQETCGGDLVLPANFRDCFRVTDQSEIRHSKFHGKFLFYQITSRKFRCMIQSKCSKIDKRPIGKTSRYTYFEQLSKLPIMWWSTFFLNNPSRKIIFIFFINNLKKIILVCRLFFMKHL